MSCDRFSEALGALVDGALPAEERPALEAHLGQCDRCRALVRDLERIRAAARGLERPMPPDRAWLTLAARLRQQMDAPPRTAAPAGRVDAGTRPRWRWLAAAAAIVIVATAAVLSLWRGRPPVAAPDRSAARSQAAQPANATLAESIETELRLAEQHYEKAIAGLEQIADAEERSLDPQVAAVLRKNLSVIDAAISESRAALRSQPESALAQESLFEAFRRKLALLEDTIALINEMRKGNQAGAARIAGGLNPS